MEAILRYLPYVWPWLVLGGMATVVKLLSEYARLKSRFKPSPTNLAATMAIGLGMGLLFPLYFTAYFKIPSSWAIAAIAFGSLTFFDSLRAVFYNYTHLSPKFGRGLEWLGWALALQFVILNYSLIKELVLLLVLIIITLLIASATDFLRLLLESLARGIEEASANQQSSDQGRSTKVATLIGLVTAIIVLVTALIQLWLTVR